jgi:hypothetical protein
MMRRIGITGVFLVAVFAFSGLVASSASAAPPKGLCWKVEFSTNGNYNNYCLEKVAAGKGTYVLAELVEEQGYHLYCAKLDGTEAVGPVEGAKCEKLLAGFTGKFVTVLFGLPTLLLLSGGNLPVELKGESRTAKTKLETKLGELTGEGFLIQGHWTNLLRNSGPASLLLTNVGEKTTKCSTSGDGTGLVLIDNAEWHLVYVSLDPLAVGILVAGPVFSVRCGSATEKIKGSGLATAAPFEKWVEPSEAFEGDLSCLSNGKPGLTKYWTEAGEVETVKLEAEINGLGKFEEACENVEGTTKAFPTEMIEISQP